MHVLELHLTPLCGVATPILMVPEVEAVLALGESMEEEERVEEHACGVACGVGGVQISLRTVNAGPLA